MVERKTSIVLFFMLVFSLFLSGCSNFQSAGKAWELFLTKNVDEMNLKESKFDCSTDMVANGIYGSHNYKLVTSLGLVCGNTYLASYVGKNTGFKVTCKNAYLTGLNLYYKQKGGQLNKITTICGDSKKGKDQKANVLECKSGNAINSITFKLDNKGFVYDIVDYQCKLKPTLGCNLHLSDKFIINLNTPEQACESIFLANKYDSGEDFYLLLNSLFPSNSDLSKNKELIIENKKNVSVYYLYNNLKKQDFSDLSERIDFSNTCETIGFFGVPLFCFNKIPSNQKDNLRNMIQSLSLLKSASTKIKVNNLHE